MESKGTRVSKNYDEKSRLQSEIRREWIRDAKGERLQGIAEGTGSAPHLANSSTASSPERNECQGTHCSLIVQEEKKIVPARCPRKIEVYGKTEERTEWQGQDENWRKEKEKRNGSLVGAAAASGELAE